MYKKVYVEITNVCNLSCPFCIGNQRKPESISLANFKIILQKLKGHTKYLYLHVLGEPLLHPDIEKIIELAKEDFFINITTNGYFIKKIKNNLNIRQINISLHSYTKNSHKTIEEYLEDIYISIEQLKRSTYISLRLWVDSEYKDEIISFLEEKYHQKITGKQKLSENIYIDFEHTFIWPSLDNPILSRKGTCYALKDHIAILVDGRITPCCLDSLGTIELGNIYTDDLETIKKSPRYQNMLQGFQNNQKLEPLCQRCNFINKKYPH